MHDFRVLRDQLDVLRSAMRRRGKLDTLSASIDRGVALDLERRAMIQAVEERKAARNANSQEVARRKLLSSGGLAAVAANGNATDKALAAAAKKQPAACAPLATALVESCRKAFDPARQYSVKPSAEGPSVAPSGARPVDGGAGRGR